MNTMEGLWVGIARATSTTPRSLTWPSRASAAKINLLHHLHIHGTGHLLCRVPEFFMGRPSSLSSFRSSPKPASQLGRLSGSGTSGRSICGSWNEGVNSHIMGLSCDQCYQYSGFEAARFQNWDTPGKSTRWQSRLWNSMDSTDGWVLRGYRQGDEKQILHLFNLVFNASRNLDQWRWEFRDNPAGLAFICVAELDGEIVGHIAAIPIKMKCGDETILGAEVVDTMTHPDHRLKGMFFKLAERIHEEATGSGVSLVWGFPNQSSAPGFIKRLGWREIGTVPGLMLVLDTKPLLRLGSYMQYIRSGFLFRNWRIALSAAVALIYHPKQEKEH